MTKLIQQIKKRLRGTKLFQKLQQKWLHIYDVTSTVMTELSKYMIESIVDIIAIVKLQCKENLEDKRFAKWYWKGVNIVAIVITIISFIISIKITEFASVTPANYTALENILAHIKTFSANIKLIEFIFAMNAFILVVLNLLAHAICMLIKDELSPEMEEILMR